MKTSEALRHVLERFETRTDHEFICSTTLSANIDEKISNDSFAKIKAHIDALLKGHSTLSSWIYGEYKINPYGQGSKEKMHITRIAWIKNMIQHFEKQGD